MFAGSICLAQAHVQPGCLYNPGPPAQEMVPPREDWALLHQLSIKTIPYRHVYSPSLRLSSRIILD